MWILNRIINPETKRRLVAMLDQHQCYYADIPFNYETFLQIPDGFPNSDSPWLNANLAKAENVSDYNRLNYISNINGARNHALSCGRDYADWIIPLDASCCFSAAGWRAMVDDHHRESSSECVAVPMYRTVGNLGLQLGDKFLWVNRFLNRLRFRWDRPLAYIDRISRFAGLVPCEPQLMFHRSSTLRFNEDFAYGAGEKLEMLYRLRVRGPWDTWFPELREELSAKSENALTTVGYCGYVYRLGSGNKRAERNMMFRESERRKTMINLVQTAKHYGSMSGRVGNS